MSNIGENIKKFIDDKGISPPELWQGRMRKQTFYNYLSGKTKPRGDFLAFLVKKYGLSAYWLLTGEGEMFWGTADEEVKFLCDTIFKDPDLKKTIYHFLQWQTKNGNERGSK